MSVVGHPRQSVPISTRSEKSCEIRCCADGRQCPSNWSILDAFQQLLLLIGPTGNSTCVDSSTSL